MDSNRTIAQIANTLFDEHAGLADRLGITPFEVAEALAHACGRILATCCEDPRDAALGRMDDLRRIMEAAYETHLAERKH